MTHRISKALCSLAMLAAASLSPTARALTADSTARIIPLDAHAFAGSSVNVLANVRHTLFTEGVYQYAAYYAADGAMVLAKRRIGEDQWQTRKTSFKGNVKDAHNHISLIVDGAGYLHVSWDHHGSRLHYARAKTPGGLDIGAMMPMVGDREQSVTYPQFIRLPDGDLLFQYREGASGNGQLVMNRYKVKPAQWQRVQTQLIDGEGQRSAYWDMAADGAGTLHLAFNWRESPDVASNHDLAYARSVDGGETWTGLDGSAQLLPITQANAHYALKIAQGSNLMNAPMVAADRDGRPFLTSYWSPKPGDKPRFQVVYADQQKWKVIAGPESASAFTLTGTNTKAPPMSRASLLLEGGGEAVRMNLIYRNNQGRVIAATLDKLGEPGWTERALTRDSVGAWEPAVDPVQWTRLGESQMLVQSVQQEDGNDGRSNGKRTNGNSAEVVTSSIGVLVWSPNWERHQALHPTPQQPAPVNLNAPLRKSAVAAIAQKAADWQWQHLPAPRGGEYGLRSWTLAPLYIGTLAVAQTMPTVGLEERMLAQGDKLGWQPDKRIYHADDHAVIQAYLQLYLKHRDPKMLAPAKERLDFILANPATSGLDWGSPNNGDRWSWSDALFMAPMSWLLMYEATNDQRYLDFMNHEWWATTEHLYRPQTGLYFRDDSYADVREQNGKTIHWARGTGWAVAGLARVLEHFPKDHPDYPRYQAQFKEMAAALLAAQQADGLWRPGLLDPGTHTARETSGSSFNTFALAWGLNHQLLDNKTYGPAVTKGWNSLTASVTAEGKLENVQPIGAAPYGFDPTNSEPFATGAFLLAASEVYRLAAP